MQLSEISILISLILFIKTESRSSDYGELDKDNSLLLDLTSIQDNYNGRTFASVSDFQVP